MAVVFDATFLMPMLRPEVGFPVDSATKKPVEKAKERLDYLLDGLEKSATKILVPTPALSEILVRAGVRASQEIVETLDKSRVFRIEAFDTLAAIEVAAMTRAALDGGDKKAGIDAPWAKLKYDRQIVAIAKLKGATAIYSDDEDVAKLGHLAGIPVIRFADLDLPPEDPQLVISFEDTENVETGDEEEPEPEDETEDEEEPEDEPFQPDK